jgi:hypothetical protein
VSNKPAQPHQKRSIVGGKSVKYFESSAAMYLETIVAGYALYNANVNPLRSSAGTVGNLGGSNSGNLSWQTKLLLSLLAIKNMTEAISSGKEFVLSAWDVLPPGRSADRGWYTRTRLVYEDGERINTCSPISRGIYSRENNGITATCDEYPFYRSEQGGAENFAPRRVSLRLVPNWEAAPQGFLMNSDEGDLLRRAGVVPGNEEKKWYGVVPISSLPVSFWRSPNGRTLNINIIDNYVRKWDEIVFSTKPVNREETRTLVLNAYNIAENIFTPDIYFLISTSPEQNLILRRILSEKGSYFTLKRNLLDILQIGIQRTKSNANKCSELFLAEIPYISARSGKFRKVCNLLYEPNIYDSICHKILDYELSLTNLWIYNFYVDCVNTNCNLQIWNILKSLCEECQYLLTFDKFCIIIERPNKLYLDSEQRPHAEGKAAITFADVYEIYCNHGIKIFSKYGKIYTSNWRSEWVLLEENSLDLPWRLATSTWTAFLSFGRSDRESNVRTRELSGAAISWRSTGNLLCPLR